MEEYRVKIEEHAGTMEKLGLSPVAARVYVYLFFCPDHEASFDEIIQFFDVSKSAISNALKYLALVDMIEARTKHGRRKRYFSLRLDNMMSASLAVSKFEILKNMLTDIRTTRKKKDAFAKDLQDIVDFFNLLITEFPVLLEKWKKNTKA
ncbi:MAG: hypothetical protein J0H74_17295 [Chitinophagaceae bacterium]|nr:hypothetical protein [Chitinophagaceae bacterium]